MKYTLSIFIFLFSCAVQNKLKLNNSLIVNAPKSIVFNQTMICLQERGYIINVVDKNAGFISTDYRINHIIILGYTRVKLSFTILEKEKGICTIYIQPIAEYSAEQRDWSKLELHDPNIKTINSILKQIKQNSEQLNNS